MAHDQRRSIVAHDKPPFGSVAAAAHPVALKLLFDLQLRRLSLVGDHGKESECEPDFQHQLSTLAGLQALQVPAPGPFCG